MDSHIVIEHARRDDLAFLIQSDSPIRDMEAKVFRREVLVARLNGPPVGWLRFNYFWDTIPFMNMLFVLAPHRGQSIGTRLVTFWEAEMLSLGYHAVLTSTQADETAQHFYRKIGYIDVGEFLLPSEPNEELLLHKSLG